MANYFKEYPKIDYIFADGTIQNLVDLNIKFDLSDVVKSTHDVFYPFGWRDTDRPDSIADKYYDTSNFYWLVLMSNSVFDINHDLPIPQEAFYDYLTVKYKDDVIANGGTENLESILDYLTTHPHHYEDIDGYVIDYDTFLLSADNKMVSLFDHEVNTNETKREIRLLDSSRASRIQTELESKLRTIKARQE